MSWKEFIAALVSALAWPAAVTLAVLLFRNQVQALLEGPIKRWKAGPFEFENDWANATQRVGQNVVTRDALVARNDELDDLLDLAEKAPAPAILAAHNAVEDYVREIATAASIDDTDAASIDDLSRVLAERGLIDHKTDESLRGLVVLRNLAAHGPEPEGRRAREYIVLAEAVMYALSRSKAAQAIPQSSAPPEV